MSDWTGKEQNHLRLMLARLIYAYANGVFLSRWCQLEGSKNSLALNCWPRFHPWCDDGSMDDEVAGFL
ncbi:hypothetical protein AA0488_2643 [Kozakia baliensis NRIC 0488]|nr:hypothetical protein AA0488_2643 [Kozakia baliensis NRIC 0488]GEL65551.1 hypothetical protein KBA01_28370 [Kozakia baliensis]